jgi:protein arginine kinase activator
MQCQQCGTRPAVIHLTQIVDNTHTEQHLCEVCAAAEGIQTEASLATFPLGNLLAGLDKGAAAAQMPPVDAGRCPACGASLQDFRDSGRLGCAECYRAFEAPLRTLLRRIHGASRHIGEPYVAPLGAPVTGEVPARPPADLAALRTQLQRAVDAENFELAARLRDEIRDRE